MKTKFILSALLTVVMAVSVVTPVIALSVSVNERAAPAEEKAALEINEKNMETALLAIKKLIEIDADVLTEFQYSYYDYQYNNNGESVGTWNFSWYNKDYSKSIYATVLDNGYVMSFNIYKSKSDYAKKLMNITRGQAEKTAESFIKTIMPDSAKYYKCGSYYTSLDSDNISLTYYAEINGYTFYNLSVTVNIDKFNGEITNMSREIMQVKDYTFVPDEGVISQADALNAYDKKLGLELVYSYYYDYSKSELKIFPAYQVKNSGKYIDALTGEVLNIEAGQNYVAAYGAKDQARAESAMMSYEDSGFSAAESAALESVKNAISSEKAIQIIKDLIEIDGNMSEIESSASLSKHSVNKDQYLWNIYIYSEENRTVYASVDAKTGEVVSYQNYDNYREIEKDAERLSEEILNDKALEIIAKLSSANLKDYADKTNYENLKDSNNYSMIFYKKVNGIPYLGSSISITINSTTGKLQNYSNTDYICENFPDVSTVKPPKEVLGIISQTIPYGIRYESIGYNEETKKYDTALIYDFKSTLSKIDPFTGKFLSYEGTITETNEIEPDYSDITDDYLKKAVEALINNGVELWNGKFLASKEMTEKEFYEIASSFFYSSGIRYYSYNEKEKTFSDSPIKRKEACKIVCELLGYGDLAKNHKIFANPFTNSIDLEYRGYVAVCNGLDMLRQDNINDMYNANANLTRADLVYMLYGYIKNN